MIVKLYCLAPEIIGLKISFLLSSFGLNADGIKILKFGYIFIVLEIESVHPNEFSTYSVMLYSPVSIYVCSVLNSKLFKKFSSPKFHIALVFGVDKFLK